MTEWEKEILSLSKQFGSLLSQVEQMTKSIDRMSRQLDELRKDNLTHYKETSVRLEKVESDIDILAQLGRKERAKLAQGIEAIATEVDLIKEDHNACQPMITFFKAPKWVKVSALVGVIALFVKESRDVIINLIQGWKLWW